MPARLQRVLTQYRPHGVTDAVFFRIYQRMLADGDFEHRFGVGMEFLSGFFGSLQEPTVTLYAGAATAAHTPWCVFWLAPLMSAIHFSLWLAPEYRQSKRGAAAVLEALSVALDEHPVVIVTTTEARLVKHYRRFGFAPCGMIPDLVPGGELTRVWYLTRPAFAETRARYARLAEAA